ncbi:MAG TPA: OmpA family protein, partial [Cytophagaceae bacterium]|jgi:chemotaxis protein MotB
MNFKTFTIYSLACTLLFSCVTRKKYDDLTQKKSRLETEKAECDGVLQSLSAEKERLNDQIEKLTVENTALKKDSTETGIFLRTSQRNYAHLNETYEKLLKNQDRLQSNSAAELSRRERDLLSSEKQINELKGDLSLREEKLKELEKVLADKDKAVNELKDRVSKALLNFKEKDLTVNVKNGKVYVSLNEQLLFKSGSTEVDPKGAEALKTLSTALKNQDDVSVTVEGHTDDVPVGKLAGGAKDNWDLSVLRATSITKILVAAGLSPSKVVPSGRGEFSPVAEGKTAEARQKNRRTEIILTPKLDELFRLLDNK